MAAPFLCCSCPGLERLYVLSLQTLRASDDVELHRLTFLKALETAGDDRGVVREYIFPVLTADEAESFSVVEPLHCPLFHICSPCILCLPE